MKFKLKTVALIMTAAVAGAGCGGTAEKAKPLEIDNQMTAEQIAEGRFTPEVMWKMGRIGGHALSPEGSQAVYSATWYSIAENRSVTNLYIIPADGGEPRQITDNVGSDTDPSWDVAGDHIYFMSDRSGETQVWRIKPDGTGMKQFTHIEGGIEGYGIAPSEDKLFYVQRVHVENRASADIHPDMEKSQALIYDDLMVRHWNYWDRGSYMHIFIADIDGSRVGQGTDIMPGEPWDAPLAPYFDMAQIAWNNAGTQLAYTSKKLTGVQYARETDSDIYVYDVATGETVNINKMNAPSDPLPGTMPMFPGYDTYPVFSPDDRYIAFLSMERPGNEADKDRLFVWDSVENSFAYLTENFDSHASNVIWQDNSTLLFIAPLEGTHQVCRVAVGLKPQVDVVTSGYHDIGSLELTGGRCLVSLTTQTSGSELYTLEEGALTQLTDINGHIYENMNMGEVQRRWIRTTDGKQMLTFVVLPPDFDPAKKYPALLYCQGGPQSTFEWSYRWNFQLMAAQGYVIVAPNRRGVPGFGQEWIDQISGDYSGQNIRDLLVAIDEVSKEPWVNSDCLGCVGASYGGYSSFYLAGTHNKRFKAFISHCGIYNFESMYGHTEELFFVNNDYGGPFWDKENKIAQRSYANSPHRFADKWDTPILIITGLNDFRIPYTQSLEAFTAARVRGLDARLMAFENEAHQVFKPQNNIVWNREFFGWLDKYLK